MTDAPGRERGIAFTSAARAEFAELTADYDGPAEWEAVVAAFGDYLQEGHGARPVVRRARA